MRFIKKFCVIFFSLLFLAHNVWAQSITKQDQNFNRDLKNYNAKLKIFDGEEKIAEFSVAIANSQSKREYGLMNLEKLDKQYGMLFIFDHKQIINMWMKNTKLALDMIFIDENNKIVNVYEGAEPFSLAIISSKKPVQKVLEINANLSKEFGIKNGQKIVYENF
jgi:uncharacterized membrane protein (UPF0127 family)